MLSNVVAFAGRAGAGKTTYADYTLKAIPGSRKVSFAKPLKDIAREVMGFTEEQLYGTQSQKEAQDLERGMSSREFLELLGKACRRHIHPEVWIDAAHTAIQTELRSGASVVVMDDCRYANEGSALKTWGSSLVHLHRHDAPERDPFPSEHELPRVREMSSLSLVHGEGSLETALRELELYLKGRGFDVQVTAAQYFEAWKATRHSG